MVVHVNDYRAPTSGGTIAYRVQGSAGPAVLLLAGGDGDIDRQQPLASLLAEHHRVITHDRRGLSASTADPDGSTMSTHACDLIAVLGHARLAGHVCGAVSVFGTSTGGLLALQLAAWGLVGGGLVVHEAFLPALVEPDDVDDALDQVQHIAAQGDIGTAMRLLTRLVGYGDGHVGDAEPPIPAAVRAGVDRQRNMVQFLGPDLTSMRRHPLSRAALAAVPTAALTLAAATDTTGRYDHRCMIALAQLTGCRLQLWPGGHSAPSTHPRATADRIRHALAGSPDHRTNVVVATAG